MKQNDFNLYATARLLTFLCLDMRTRLSITGREHAGTYAWRKVQEETRIVTHCKIAIKIHFFIIARSASLLTPTQFNPENNEYDNLSRPVQTEIVLHARKFVTSNGVSPSSVTHESLNRWPSTGCRQWYPFIQYRQMGTCTYTQQRINTARHKWGRKNREASRQTVKTLGPRKQFWPCIQPTRYLLVHELWLQRF